jgi:hypothetical protein
MRAPVIKASLKRAWSFGCLSHASSSRRCSSTDRIRVRRFCNLNRSLPGWRIDEVLPLDRLGEDGLQRIELAVHSPRLDGFSRSFLPERTPRSRSTDRV